MKPPPLKGRSLGERIQEVQDNLQINAAEFLRQLHRAGRKTTRATLDNWKKNLKRIETDNIRAIAEVSGYTVDELLRDPGDVSETAPLRSQAELGEYLDSIGASPDQKKTIMARGVAAPPVGGVTRRWARDLLEAIQAFVSVSAKQDTENAESDARLRQKDAQSDTLSELARDVRGKRASDVEKVTTAVAPRRRRRKK